jgi:hypothetical protein
MREPSATARIGADSEDENARVTVRENVDGASGKDRSAGKRRAASSETSRLLAAVTVLVAVALVTVKK